MGPHGDELPIDLRLVARYICVTEHVVSVQEVARRDHRGPMDAGQTMNRDGAALLQRGPHAFVDPIYFFIRPFSIRRVPCVHRVRDDVRALARNPGRARLIGSPWSILVAVDDEPQVLEDALVRELSTQRFFVAQDDGGRPPETQPGHDAIVRPRAVGASSG